MLSLGEDDVTKTLAEHFALWLAENRSRFPVKVVAYRKSAEGATYRFVGAPRLRLRVGAYQVEIWAAFRRDWWDILVEFDVFLERASNGTYYCKECERYRVEYDPAAIVEYFPDPMSLYVKHSFEPCLDWCQEKLRNDRLLVLHGGDGVNTAYIMTKRELRERRERRSGPSSEVLVTPVLARR